MGWKTFAENSYVIYKKVKIKKKEKRNEDINDSQTLAGLNHRWLIRQALLQCDAQAHMRFSVNPKLPPLHLLQDASTRTEHVLKTNSTTCTGVQTRGPKSQTLGLPLTAVSCYVTTHSCYF